MPLGHHDLEVFRLIPCIVVSISLKTGTGVKDVKGCFEPSGADIAAERMHNTAHSTVDTFKGKATFLTYLQNGKR